MRTLRSREVSSEESKLLMVVRLRLCLGKAVGSFLMAEVLWQEVARLLSFPSLLAGVGRWQLKQALGRVLQVTHLKFTHRVGVLPGLWGLLDFPLDFGTEDGPRGNT